MPESGRRRRNTKRNTANLLRFVPIERRCRGLVFCWQRDVLPPNYYRVALQQPQARGVSRNLFSGNATFDRFKARARSARPAMGNLLATVPLRWDAPIHGRFAAG